MWEAKITAPRPAQAKKKSLQDTISIITTTKKL
jgi:hypothetical protein